jgi:endonuclease G
MPLLSQQKNQLESKHMKKLISLLALVFSISAFAELPNSCDQMVAFGYPVIAASVVTEQNMTRLCRLAYTVEHDNLKKVPVYSAELLTKERSGGTNKRINAFKADPDLEIGQRAELSDYDKKYDRGHMTPFEDAKWQSAASLQTFYLSNMVPQDLHLNRGLWRAIENRTRGFAAQSTTGVYVITGPVYEAGYTTIGDNKVAVPTKVFKVIIDKEKMQSVAYLVPNTSPLPGVTPNTYKVSVAEVELATHINFTPLLTSGQEFKSIIGKEFE